MKSFGADERSRTFNVQFTKLLLCHLSYIGKLEDEQRLALCLAGLQPAASSALASRPKILVPPPRFELGNSLIKSQVLVQLSFEGIGGG